MSILPDEIVALILEEALNEAPVSFLEKISRVCHQWRAIVFCLPLRVHGLVGISFLDLCPSTRFFSGTLMIPDSETREGLRRVLKWVTRNRLKEVRVRTFDLHPSLLQLFQCGLEAIHLIVGTGEVHLQYSGRNFEIRGPWDEKIWDDIEFIAGNLEVENLSLLMEVDSEFQDALIVLTEPRVLRLSERTRRMADLSGYSIEELEIVDSEGNIGMWTFEDYGYVFPSVKTLRCGVSCCELHDLWSMFPNVREWRIQISCSNPACHSYYKLLRSNGHKIHGWHPRACLCLLIKTYSFLLPNITRYLNLRDLCSFSRACRRTKYITELSGDEPERIIPLPYGLVFSKAMIFDGFFEVRNIRDLRLLKKLLTRFRSRGPWRSTPKLSTFFLRVIGDDDLIDTLIRVLVKYLPRVLVDPDAWISISFPNEPNASIQYNSDKEGYDLVLPSRFSSWRNSWEQQVSIGGTVDHSFTFFY